MARTAVAAMSDDRLTMRIGDRWGCMKFCGQAGTSSTSNEAFGLYFQLLPVL
jgi:hypothetical protein